MQIVIKMRN